MLRICFGDWVFDALAKYLIFPNRATISWANRKTALKRRGRVQMLRICFGDWVFDALANYVNFPNRATISCSIKIPALAGIFIGGEGGIRTLDTLRYTRFPSVRTRPTMRPLRELYFWPHYYSKKPRLKRYLRVNLFPDISKIVVLRI